MNIIRGNKVNTKVNLFINGTLHSKEFGSEEGADIFFKKVIEYSENPSDDNIKELYGFLNKNIRIARKSGLEYDIESGDVYLKGFNTRLPKKLVETIEDYIEKDYPFTSIVNFWKLLMANPDVRVRDDLFNFIGKHDFSITDKGYMIVYKTVDYLRKMDKDLAEMVSKTFFTVQKTWKKSPANYIVYKEFSEEKIIVGGHYDMDGYDNEDEFYEENGYYPDYIEEHEENNYVFEYKFTESKTFDKWLSENKENIDYVGNLANLMETIGEIKEENKSVYTDKYSHSMKIRLGEPVSMERIECDFDPKTQCSYGLHVGATKYVERFRNYGVQNLTDDISPVLVCLVNPMNVIAVPDYDNSKMRVCEYYPFARGTVENESIDIIESPYFESDYMSHEESTLNELIRLNDEELREKIMDVVDDDREVDEYIKILESRVIDLSDFK